MDAVEAAWKVLDPNVWELLAREAAEPIRFWSNWFRPPSLQRRRAPGAARSENGPSDGPRGPSPCKCLTPPFREGGSDMRDAGDASAVTAGGASSARHRSSATNRSMTRA